MVLTAASLAEMLAKIAICRGWSAAEASVQKAKSMRADVSLHP